MTNMTLMAQTLYMVIDEVTLGYMHEEVSPTATLYPLAGYHDWKNGGVAVEGSKVRPATEDDFERFRVTLPPDFVVPKVQRCASAVANKECQFAGPADKKGLVCQGSESKHAICTYSAWQKPVIPDHVHVLGMGKKMPCPNGTTM